jgi:hypothetical protein
MNKLRLFIGFLILFCLFGPATAAGAASQVTIARLQVDIWPEFDRPNVLVIYHLTLSPDTSLPATMTLHIPGQTGGPFNLAMKDADGLLYNLDYKTPVMENGLLAITFTTPTPEIQLEYYDPDLKRQGTTRSFEYRWSGDYTVQSFTAVVQQPTTATNMQLQPNMGTASKAADGFNYFTKPVGAVDASSSVFIRLTYDKADDSLSSTSQPVQPVQPVTPKTSGRISFLDALPWALGALGLVIIGAGLMWYWQSNNRRREPGYYRHDRHKPSHSPRQAGTAAGSRTVVYCHQCGRMANPGDVFCRACGARLRQQQVEN